MDLSGYALWGGRAPCGYSGSRVCDPQARHIQVDPASRSDEDGLRYIRPETALVLVEDRILVIVIAVCVDKDHAGGHPGRAGRLGPLGTVIVKCAFRIDAEIVLTCPFD